MSWFRLKACPKCQGDLASDDGDWLCLQCGTYYYTGLYRNGGFNGIQRPRFGLEPESRSNVHSGSPPEPTGQQGPDYPPEAKERSLGRPLVASHTTAAAPALTPSPHYVITKIELAIHRQ